jgi:hypothetical protein
MARRLFDDLKFRCNLRIEQQTHYEGLTGRDDVKGLIFLLAMFAIAMPAAAQRGKDARGFDKGAARPMPQRQATPRSAEQKTGEASHDKRMSPSERQQLRRDVNSHGREIYRAPPGAGRR